MIVEEEARTVTDWDRIVRDHGPTVFATAWRILGHSADTEDVVQEVFLQAHVMARTESVRSWEALLRRLAHCRALDKLRARRKPASLDDSSIMDGPSSDPSEIVAERELSERLRWALGQLPPREASVFCLRYFDDMPYDEIASSLGISGGAVATALHKARAKLEALLLPETQEKR